MSLCCTIATIENEEQSNDNRRSIKNRTLCNGHPRRKNRCLGALATWQALLALWEAMVEKLEEQEDLAIVQECLEKRTRGEVEMISLDALEEELLADGLLSR